MPFSYVLQALVPSQEKQKARRALRRRIRDIIRSYTEHEFDVEDFGMRKYAEDVDIAPLELVIVVCTTTYQYSCLRSPNGFCPRPFVSCRTCYGVTFALLS
jgi:hypothetical protein